MGGSIMLWLILIVGMTLLLLGASREGDNHDIPGWAAEAIRLGIILLAIGYLSLHLPLSGENINLALALGLWLWASHSSAHPQIFQKPSSLVLRSLMT